MNIKLMNCNKNPFIALFISFFILIFAISCEKEVQLDLKSSDYKPVVDGFIENGRPPLVILTKSFGYFTTIDLKTLESSFIHNAKITVNDGTNTITLKEYQIDTGNNAKFNFYSIDTSDILSKSFLGKVETYYTLTILTEGKTYTSVTKIPNLKPIDSLWAIAPSKTPDKVPNAMNLYMRYTDPDTIGNHVRYFTKRNNELFLPGLNSVFPDDIVNGTTFSFKLDAGYNSAKKPNLDSLGYFFKGDTVTLKWCTIDKSVYDFWSTFEFSAGSIGNPFASPISVISNIKGGALGAWCGYGASYSTIIIPQ